MLAHARARVIAARIQMSPATCMCTGGGAGKVQARFGGRRAEGRTACAAVGCTRPLSRQRRPCWVGGGDGGDGKALFFFFFFRPFNARRTWPAARRNNIIVTRRVCYVSTPFLLPPPPPPPQKQTHFLIILFWKTYDTN